MVPHALPILLPFSKIALSFQGFVFQSHFHDLPVWRRIALCLQHLRRMLWPQWVLSIHPPGLWDGSPWLLIPVWKKKQLLCWLKHLYVLTSNWTAVYNRMQSTKMVEKLLSAKNRWLIYCSLRHVLCSMLLTKCMQTREKPCWSAKVLSSNSKLSVVQGRRFLVQKWKARKSSFLIGFSDLGCLQTWGHS